MSDFRALMIPTVHMNGTSRDELVKQLSDAYTAIDAAMDVLRKATPHGRDYYPQGDDAWRKANKAHCDRLVKLHEVAQEILTIAEGIV